MNNVNEYPPLSSTGLVAFSVKGHKFIYAAGTPQNSEYQIFAQSGIEVSKGDYKIHIVYKIHPYYFDTHRSKSSNNILFETRSLAEFENFIIVMIRKKKLEKYL